MNALTPLILEIPSTTQDKAWAEAQKTVNPTSRWQTYLNQLTLDTFVEYAQEETEEAISVATDISELVNGVVITAGGAKFALVPTEAEDFDELRIPQEWLDVPELVADYYIAIQVNVDDALIRIGGYATHKQIKTVATYDVRTREYALDSSDIISDINALWIARELCPDEETRVEVAPVAELSSAQADNLVQRVGDAANPTPRLVIPFSMWGAILSNQDWRKDVMAQRRGENKISVLKWLKAEARNLAEMASEGWRQVEFQPSTVGARGSESATATPSTALARQLTIAGGQYELKVMPVDTDTYGFELRSLSLGGTIPVGFTLRLLDESGISFEGNEDRATTTVERLYLEVALDAGEGLIWEIEPTPEDYQAQVLYF